MNETIFFLVLFFSSIVTESDPICPTGPLRVMPWCAVQDKGCVLRASPYGTSLFHVLAQWRLQVLSSSC